MKQPTRVRLMAEGWRPGGSRSTLSAEQALRDAGYKAWPGLIRFLRGFVGLRVAIVRDARPDAFWFDPAAAAGLTTSTWVAEYCERAGQVLVPVGFAHHDHLLLLMGEDGTWYGAYDDVFGVLGSNDDEMLDSLVAGSGFQDG